MSKVKRATSVRAKNWMFTVHGNIEWDIPKEFTYSKKENGVVYRVNQEEIGYEEYKKHGMEGKRHDQCYVEFKEPITMAGIKKTVPELKTAHFDKVVAPKIAAEYCKKDYEVLRLPDCDSNLTPEAVLDKIVETSKGKNKKDFGIYQISAPDKLLRTDKIISVGVPGTREEFGTQSAQVGKGQGARTDLKAIQDDIKAGKSLLEISEIHTAFFKYHAGIEKAYELKRTRDMNLISQLPPEILWFYGGPGTGKSRIARDMFGEDIAFYKYERWDKGWWDQYDGEKDIWLNEMEPNTLDPYMLLELLDWTGVRVPRRARPPIACNPSRIIITSMSNPEEWFIDVYGDAIETDLSKALKRRIKGRTFEVSDFKIIGPNADWFNSKFILEDYKAIFEKEKTLRSKYEAKVPQVKIGYTGFLFNDVETEVGEEIVKDMYKYSMFDDPDLTTLEPQTGDVSSLGLQEVTEYDDDEEEEKE